MDAKVILREDASNSSAQKKLICHHTFCVSYSIACNHRTHAAHINSWRTRHAEKIVSTMSFVNHAKFRQHKNQFI